jgi:hypothetical protein
MVFNFQFAAKLTKKRQKSGKNKQKKREKQRHKSFTARFMPPFE